VLNAEWNQPKDRDVYLHRHPAFFGRVEDVIKDCCGCCPTPRTPEEIEMAKKEAEIYISGEISFLIDDPGRQQIGSFNPLTEDDWTDMAYVGNTARLCQSIVDCDVDEVLAWLSNPEADVNKRDYTGRTPLHLAVMSSTPDVVKCLVDHGSRLTARLADGRTALHLAADRGIAEMVKILMEKSIANEELYEEKQDRQRKALHASDKDKDKPDKPASKKQKKDESSEESQSEDESEEDSDMDIVDDATSDDGAHSFATGSFVKVKKGEEEDRENLDQVSNDEPDFFKIDVLSWDVPCSPLHLAIAEGHEEVVQLLCDVSEMGRGTVSACQANVT
jgi:ankyrin repeat protein